MRNRRLNNALAVLVAALLLLLFAGSVRASVVDETEPVGSRPVIVDIYVEETAEFMQEEPDPVPQWMLVLQHEILPEVFPLQAAGIVMSEVDARWMILSFEPNRYWLRDWTSQGRSVAWRIAPRHACDDDDDCATEANALCKGAGQGDCKEGTAEITESDAGATCHCDCEGGGIAFISCPAN